MIDTGTVKDIQGYLLAGIIGFAIGAFAMVTYVASANYLIDTTCKEQPLP